MSSDVLSAEAETSSGLIFATLGFLQASLRNPPYTLGPTRLLGGTTAFEEIELQAALVRIVTIAESYISDLLIDHGGSVIEAAGHDLIRSIWKDAMTSATRNWESRVKAYQDWFGIQVAYASVRPYVDARNAVAHGLGTLTRRQRNDGTRARLTQAGIDVQGDHLILTEKNVLDAATACRALVEALDRALPS